MRVIQSLTTDPLKHGTPCNLGRGQQAGGGQAEQVDPGHWGLSVGLAAFKDWFYLCCVGIFMSHRGFSGTR